MLKKLLQYFYHGKIIFTVSLILIIFKFIDSLFNIQKHYSHSPFTVE
jgi:hypothetical protein